MLRAKRHRRLLLRNIAQRTALSSFKVKYQWPEEGWLKLEISPLIQTAHFALKQQTHRLIEAAYGKIAGIERVTCEQDQTLNQQVIQSIVTRSEDGKYYLQKG